MAKTSETKRSTSQTVQMILITFYEEQSSEFDTSTEGGLSVVF